MNLSRAIGIHPKLGRRYASASRLLNRKFRPGPEPFERLQHAPRRRSRINQRPDGHVPADPRKRVKITDFHKQGRSPTCLFRRADARR